MSSDFHIKFDGVQGEATHKEHKGEIEILSWNWEVAQTSGAVSGGGSGRGKAIAGDFVFTHRYDKASPVLAKQCVSGKHFKDAKVTARKAGEGQKSYLTILMREVFITSVTPSGETEGDITEEVKCSYKYIEYAYKAQDDKGGLGGEVKFGWNVSTTETQ